MKKKYVVDVFRTLAQSVEIEAENEEQAEQIAESMVKGGSICWDLQEHLTDDFEVETSGEVDEDGERLYY